MQPETDKQPAPPIAYRDGRPAWNVKYYKGPTAEECAQVFADYGERPADALARPGTDTGDALPWGPAWIDALIERNPARFYEAIGDAARDGFEHAEEYARELFGARANVYSDGRSSGWLVLHHPTITRDEIEAARATISRPAISQASAFSIRTTCRFCLKPAHDNQDWCEDYAPAVEELCDARELLDNLDTFGRYIASALADHGRAQAFELLRLFEYYAQELAEEQAEANAAARLDRARTAFEDAATRLRDAAVACDLGDSPQVRTARTDHLHVCAEAFDAARLELERAKGGAS